MNKEQVQLHGEVIKWFCDNPDKGVWYKSKDTNIWFKTDAPTWGVSTIYVQNDEYAEFRKALAEDKIVQYNSNVGLYPTIWIDWDLLANFTDSDKLYRPSDIRIKPDEPKFKVGDFVTSQSGKISQLIENDISKCLETKGYKLWKPKPNEYVWYGYELVQVIDNSDTIKICRQDSDVYEEVTLDKLEPFVDKLPSFIKY